MASIEYRRAYAREWYRSRRREAIARYGGKCACCGESEHKFLALDHIDGGGNAHRRRVGMRGGGGTLNWLVKNGYPPGFQVLCHNCNMAKGFWGECPHLTNLTGSVIQ